MGMKTRFADYAKQREFFRHVVIRNRRSSYRIYQGKNKQKLPQIIGILRVRNEELLLEDTLKHLSTFVDGFVIYDDCSEDDTVSIALKHPKVFEVIVGKKWLGNVRAWEETANRRLLFKRAKKRNPS